MNEKPNFDEIEKKLNYEDSSTFHRIKWMISYFENMMQEGASAISNTKIRSVAEQEQKDLYSSSLRLLGLWQEGLTECGKVQEPISKLYRQSPRLNDIIELMITLVDSHRRCIATVFQHKCNALGNVIREQHKNIEDLACQIEGLKPKLGENEICNILREIESLKKVNIIIMDSMKKLEKNQNDNIRMPKIHDKKVAAIIRKCATIYDFKRYRKLQPRTVRYWVKNPSQKTYFMPDSWEVMTEDTLKSEIERNMMAYCQRTQNTIPYVDGIHANVNDSIYEKQNQALCLLELCKGKKNVKYKEWKKKIEDEVDETKLEEIINALKCLLDRKQF